MLPAFDIYSPNKNTVCADVLIENVLLVNLTALAVIGKNSSRDNDRPANSVPGPSRVTLRQISGDYNLDQAKDTVLVNGGTNLRFVDGKFNGGFVKAVPTELPGAAMIRFQSNYIIDTYSILNWGSQAKSADNGALQKYGLVIDCTNGSCVNGTATGTCVFDHVSEAGVYIKSSTPTDGEAGPDDLKFGGLVAVGLRSSADGGVSRKVEWLGPGFFRGYVEIGSRLQAAETALLTVTAGEATPSFQPPLFQSCTFRSFAPTGATLPHVFDISAPCSIVDCTIDNSGAPRIARLGIVYESPVWRMTGCTISDVIDPTIEYLDHRPAVPPDPDHPPLPVARNPLTVLTSNSGFAEDTVLENAWTAAVATGPYNLTTARWLRSGSADPAMVSSQSRKTIYDTLIQTLYDLDVIERFGFLALLGTRDVELSLHDMLTPGRRLALAGAPLFTPDKGWRGTAGATPGLLRTGYIPSADTKLQDDSFAVLVCCAGPDISSSAFDLGTGTKLQINVRNSAGQIAARFGTATTVYSTAPSTPSGIGTFLCNRDGNTITFFDATGARGSATSAGSTLPDGALSLCGVGTIPNERTIRAAGVLKGFDPDDPAQALTITKMIAAFETCFEAINDLG